MLRWILGVHVPRPRPASPSKLTSLSWHAMSLLRWNSRELVQRIDFAQLTTFKLYDDGSGGISDSMSLFMLLTGTVKRLRVFHLRGQSRSAPEHLGTFIKSFDSLRELSISLVPDSPHWSGPRQHPGWNTFVPHAAVLRSLHVDGLAKLRIQIDDGIDPQITRCEEVCRSLSGLQQLAISIVCKRIRRCWKASGCSKSW